MDEIKFSDGITRKKMHPLERANVISKLFFCWLIPYFLKGYRRELTEDDMYGPLETHESGTLGDKLEKEWNSQLDKKSPSLWFSVLKVFQAEIIFNGFAFVFMELVVKLSFPILVSKFLEYYEPNQTKMTKDEACFYAGLIVALSLVNVLCSHAYQLRVFHLGIKMRVAACSLIYRKALKLNTSALAETTIGQMVNLLSNDVGRFDYAAQHFHSLWLAPVETLFIMYIVYLYVGPTGLMGACFLLLFIPFQIYMGKKTSSYRLRTALRTDERVRLMSEIITGIQVIKMYTWEKSFAKLVEIARRKEMQEIRATSIIRALTMSFNLVLNRGAIYFCILTYVLTGNTVTATYAYTVSLFYGILRIIVTNNFPQAVTQFAETNVSMKRIQKFLLEDEVSLEDFYNVKLTGNLKLIQNEQMGIHLKDVSVKWLPSSPDCTLENITFDVDSNQLVALVGPVGSGKTTLLHVILKELSPLEGCVYVYGTISYASQEPWLFGGSVRQNIIFGQEFNSKKYEEVIRVCALERDFKLLPYGDRTLVGDRGVTLSGGQRARINLARAIYKDADIYLLDDPLSAVDAHVGKQIFCDCVSGYLKEKCVVLVTHQLQYLRNIDTIYLLEDGRVEASGSYKVLKATDSEFTRELTDSQEEDRDNHDRKSKLIDKKSSEANQMLEPPDLEKEQKFSGTISSGAYKLYFTSGGDYFKTTMLLVMFIACQVFASATDYFVSLWVNLEQWRSENAISNYTAVFSNNTNSPTSTASTSLNKSLQSYMDKSFSEQVSLIVYSSLVLLTMVITINRSISFFRYCITASTKLHNMMFDKIVYATMKFFNTNPSGRILNRFSKDIGAVDEILPFTIVDTLQIGLTVMASCLIIGALNPWILIPTGIILTFFYGMRIVFLATSRDIKRVEAVTRSPMFTHLAASLQGLTTIRAFGAQSILKKEFDNYQNKYTSASFMFLGANRTFGFWLDFHCVIYIALVTISILFVENETFGGNVGLALTQVLSITGLFQWGIRQWSELENQMTSVERIKEYIEVEPESNGKVKNPPNFWPEEGGIKFVKLSLRYSSDDPYVLNNLTFEINPQEKIGIVGRTGAGKSSLISALFRLTDIDGKILIDNVDTKEISLRTLRSRISIIPQEPVLFSGTLRKNLDPFNEYNDELLWSALDEVELKNAVTDLPAGLDSKMSEGGSNFSVGQRQLVCLARAIIRNNKILVLDEATANVDPQTDGLIQNTIRRKFANCTVLTIAHRLNTVMDSDKVLVMDAGSAAEFDHPYTLLQNPDSVFSRLVKQTGRAMSEYLLSIAEDSYMQLSTKL